MKIALITDSENPQLVPSDQLLVPEFKKVGINAIPVVWEDEKINLKQFDALIIRNTWDYFLKVEQFKAWVTKIEELQVPIFNSLDHIRDNMHKFYLKKMADKGVDIIPTLFKPESEKIDSSKLLDFNADKFIIKPAISAGSYQTKILGLSEVLQISESYKKGDWLIQPFLNEIQSFGEISLIYFNRKFVYAIHKKAQSGDFRVQYQFGGLYSVFEPTNAQLEAADKIMNNIPGDLLFARVDGIMVKDKFLLMEIELIEPDLYFSFVAPAARLFVNATLELLASKN